MHKAAIGHFVKTKNHSWLQFYKILITLIKKLDSFEE